MLEFLRSLIKQNSSSTTKKKSKKWSTRKKTLYLAIGSIIVYTTISIIVTIINANTGVAIYLDPTVTTEFFGFMKLISGLGGGLSAIGLIKQHTQPSVSEESDDETLG